MRIYTKTGDKGDTGLFGGGRVAFEEIDAPGEDELTRAANSLSDREVMELLLFGTPEEIRAALPLMSEEQKRLTLKSVAPNE